MNNKFHLKMRFKKQTKNNNNFRENKAFFRANKANDARRYVI